jgi:hypothetical protein
MRIRSEVARFGSEWTWFDLGSANDLRVCSTLGGIGELVPMQRLEITEFNH